MNKPHVEKVNYDMVFKDDVDYDKAPPVAFENDSFKMTADNGAVTFEMKESYSSEKEARLVTDKFLKQWEILTGLNNGPDEITFKFNRSEIIDLAPDPNTTQIKAEHFKGSVCFSGKATVHVSRSRYPVFPEGFSLSPDVETMYFRYKNYKEQREPLLSMAYFLLTMIEFKTGAGDKSGEKTKKKVSDKFKISFRIIDTLGKLTAKGDEQEARKMHKNNKPESLTGKEKSWIEAVCKTLIQRMGEYENKGTDGLHKITMDDLPPLN